MHIRLRIFGDLIRIAYSNFLMSKMRCFLMLLSMAIGVFSLTVVLVVSEIGKGIIFEEIQGFGINRVWAYRDLTDLIDDPNPDPWTSNKMISNAISNDIAEYCKGVRLAAPSIRRGVEVTHHGKVFEGILLVGAGSDWGLIHNERLACGRFVTPVDEARRNRICVLSGEAQKLIFGENSSLGTCLQIGGEYFTIVGILEKKERPISKSISTIPLREESIIVPITVLQSPSWLNTLNVEYLDFQVTSFNRVTQAAANVKDYLSIKYGNDPRFQVKMLYFEIQKARKIMRILSIVLGIISGIALLIAGIGIMNMMLASVFERVFEIGIRRAVGASRHDILLQFITEAVMVGMFGGLAGILGALFVALVARVLLNLNDVSLIPAIATALSVSFLTGLLAGVYPARKAAHLNPSEALTRV